MSFGMEEPFYKDGLRFTCLRCGRCCRIPDGVVYLSHSDIERLAEFLGISEEEFLEKYTVVRGKFRVLRDFPNGDCIFLRQDGCSVYPARPTQCRTFPFWRSNISSPHAWERTAAECPGVNVGRLYSRWEIELIADGKAET